MTDWIYQAAYIAFWFFAIAGCISGVFLVCGVLAHVFHDELNAAVTRLIR